MAWRIVVGTVTLAAAMLARESVRHWLGVVLANLCIVGGVVAAPLVSLLGWVGMAMPTHSLLHAAAPVLFMAALIWLGLAIVGAHVQSV